MLKLFNKKIGRIAFAVRFGFALGIMTAMPSFALLAMLWFSAISMARLADAGKPRWIGTWHLAAIVLFSSITVITGKNPIASNTIILQLFASFFFLFHLVLMCLPSASETKPSANLWRAMFLNKAQRSELSAKAASLRQLVEESRPASQIWNAEVKKLTEMVKVMTEYQQSMSKPSTPEERAELEKIMAEIKVQQAVCDDHEQRCQPTTDAIKASTTSLNEHMRLLGITNREAA
jgi:uncharacterized membrane protein YhaH (DUF805 family)